jgi:senataxin
VLFDNKQSLGGLVPADGVHGIEINTVDAYQGREKDIIIVSTVRTDGIGFLQDYRRMNVAITRAKNFMWIVGNQKNLQRNDVWSAMTKSIELRYTFE